MSLITITDYKILTHEKIEDLERAVRQLLKQTGWRPTGAPVVTIGGTCLQAMIKYELVNQNEILITDHQAEIIKQVNEPMMSLYFRRIQDCNLRIRAINCLNKTDIYLLGDLVQKSESDIMKIQELGRVTFNNIIGELNKLGLQLKTKFTSNQLMQLEQYKKEKQIGF